MTTTYPTEDQLRILARICTRDEAGTHFTQIYTTDELSALEEMGLIEISKPIHAATGIAYGQEEWSVRVTEDGQAWVDSHPEFHPDAADDLLDWQTVEMTDSDNQPIGDGAEYELRVRALREFRKHGWMSGVFFGRCGYSHEVEEDASTWGPRDADQINWTEFPEAE